MNILFLDVETTGTNPNKHSMIEVAARLDIDGKTIDKFTKKFFNATNTTIDLGALKVNNTKLNDLVKFPAEIAEIANFVDWLLGLQSQVQGPIVVCGQNVQFDVNFIKATLAKYNVEGVEQIIGYKHIDTYSIALALKEAGILKTDKTNLSAIAKALGVDVSQYKLHTAEGDVDLVAAVYYAIILTLKSLGTEATITPE